MSGSFFAARASDRVGRPRTAAWATGLAVAGYAVAFSPGLPLGACLGAWAVGLGAFAQASLQLSALVAELFPASQRGAASGLSEVVFTLGGSAGLVLEALLCRHWDRDGGAAAAAGSLGSHHSPAARALALVALATIPALVRLPPASEEEGGALPTSPGRLPGW